MQRFENYTKVKQHPNFSCHAASSSWKRIGAVFNVVFTFLKETDKSMKSESNMVVSVRNFNPEIEHLKNVGDITYLSFIANSDMSDFDSTGYQHIGTLERYIRAQGLKATVLIKDCDTRIYWEQSITHLVLDLKFLIPFAFSLKTLCPAMFTGKDTDLCPEHRKAWDCVIYSKWDDAWNIISPYVAVSNDEIMFANLRAFFSKGNEPRIRGYEDDISDLYLNIEDYRRQMASCYARIRELQDQIMLLRLSTDHKEQCDEFITLLKNFGGEITNAQNNDGEFTVRLYGTIDNYDMRSAKNCIEDHRSGLYASVLIPAEQKERLRELYKKVFLERKYKLCVSDDFIINTEKLTVHADKGDYNIFHDRHNNEYLTNPHLYYFGCFGGHDDDIVDCLNKYDLSGVLMILNSSLRNLNFGDPSPMKYFSEQVCLYMNTKLFVNKNDKRMSAEEILKEEGI